MGVGLGVYMSIYNPTMHSGVVSLELRYSVELGLEVGL